MNATHRRYLESLPIEDRFKATNRMQEAACRRCATEQGFSADWRCHGNASPLEADCKAWHQILDDEILAACCWTPCDHQDCAEFGPAECSLRCRQ